MDRNPIVEENLNDILKNYITKEELHGILTSSRSASEQFLDTHDRAFREIELNLNTKVAELNAGLSKLNLMSDALSQVMRVQSDNYEAMRITQRSHEERLSRLETLIATQKEELSNFYGSIFGDAAHPDQESMASMMRNRSEKADKQHLELMGRLEILETQVQKWQKLFTFAMSNLGNSMKGVLPKVIKFAIISITIPTIMRIVNAPLVEQIGILFRWYVLGQR